MSMLKWCQIIQYQLTNLIFTQIGCFLLFFLSNQVNNHNSSTCPKIKVFGRTHFQPPFHALLKKHKHFITHFFFQFTNHLATHFKRSPHRIVSKSLSHFHQKIRCIKIKRVIFYFHFLKRKPNVLQKGKMECTFFLPQICGSHN